MTKRVKVIFIALCLSMTGMAAACSSSPEVPDQKQTKKNTYKSTEEGAQDGEQQAAAESGQQGQQAESQIPQATGPIAHIDGEPVPAARFNTEIQKIAKSGQFPIKLLGQVKGEIIKKIVDKALVDRALENAAIEVPDQKVEERIDEIRAEFAKANQQAEGQMGSLEQLVSSLGISEAEFRESVRDSLAIEQLLIKRGMEYPTTEEIRAFYEENTEMFERDEQVQARHILLRVEAEEDDAAWEKAHARALEIREMATKEGADFAELATEYSEGPTKSRGGQLPWFGRGKMVPEFEEAAFALEKGGVSEPVRTQFGWHIIKKVDAREAGQVPFEEVQPQLESKMRNQRVQEAMQGLLDSLHTEKKIELHPENVK